MNTETATTVLRSDRPHILCVDDEPHILESLRDTLRRTFDVSTAASGPQGLAQLDAAPGKFAVIISDMQMPVMSGAVFLREARRMAPDAVRMLLTGYADVDSAVSAVNEGQLFRFLTKPCRSADLIEACRAAHDQHRLQTAERDLLEHTVKGSVKALVDTLALASPAAFGRSARVRKLVAATTQELGLADGWEVEMAALLVNLGAVTLPPETAEKLYAGAALTPGEQEMVDRIPDQTRRILGNIPRLEGVIEILKNYPRATGHARALGDMSEVSDGSRILRMALDFDDLEARGADRDIALSTLQGRGSAYDANLLDALARAVGRSPAHVTVREIRTGQLRAGMMLASDIRSDTGSLLIARGHTATEQLVTRLMNLRVGSIREPLLVVDDDV